MLLANIQTKKYLSRISLGVFLGIFLYMISGAYAAVELNLNANYDQEIWQLNQQINDKRKEADSLKQQADLYQKSLASKQRQVASLNYQISTLNETITKISLEKQALEAEVDEINLRIENNKLKIQATEEQVNEQKGHLAELVRALYQNDRQDNLVMILATNNDLSDYLSQLQHLQSIQGGVLNGIDSLGTLKMALVNEQSSLDSNKTDLNNLQDDLASKTDMLESQKAAKSDLIDETKGQEGKYQSLLQDLKDQQERTNNDIVSLEQVAREKLNRQIQAGTIKDLGAGPMIWPIASRRITAYFHDPDYPFRNVFEHPAIDIATPQGTPIAAAASGYVARAKDGGMGYSYIMLIHDNGISTVYGHVSEIDVTEGTFVTQGQIIGKSGATPGTPGAGPFTTGPHLHFEVRLNGIPVNPLNYLPQ